jgi:hypothetical protein
MSHLSHLVLLPCLALLALALLVRLPPPPFFIRSFYFNHSSGTCRAGRVSARHLPPHPLGRLRALPARHRLRPTRLRGTHHETTAHHPQSAQTPDLMSALCLPTIEVHPVWSGLRGGGCGQHALHGVRAGILLVGGRQRQMHPVPAPFLLGRWRHPLRPVQLFGPVIDLSCIYTCICLVYF